MLLLLFRARVADAVSFRKVGEPVIQVGVYLFERFDARAHGQPGFKFGSRQMSTRAPGQEHGGDRNEQRESP